MACERFLLCQVMIFVSQYNIVEISFIILNINELAQYKTVLQVKCKMKNTLCFKSVKISDYRQ